MATKLFLRSTQTNGIGSTYFDMVTTQSPSPATAVVGTVSGGTEIQWTQTNGGSVIQWVSGRAPAGGFTLTSTDIQIWAQESQGTANCGGRYRVFKRTSAGVETELGGGPFNDGVEFGTSSAAMTWIGNVTDTAFAEDDRILLKVYITNIGTMGSGKNCTLTYDGATGVSDSWLNLAETVTFKAETTTHDGTGALTGPGTSVAGTAAHIAVHGTSGAIAGPGAVLSGIANRFRAFAAVGAVVGAGSAIVGSAARTAGTITHATSGALSGAGAAISASASRFRAFAATGALVAAGAAVNAVAALSGSAAKSGAANHAVSGNLIGQGSAVVGHAATSPLGLLDLDRRYRGWSGDWRRVKMRRR